MKITLTTTACILRESEDFKEEDFISDQALTVEVEGSAASCLGELASTFGVDGMAALLKPHGFEPVADGNGLSLRLKEAPQDLRLQVH